MSLEASVSPGSFESVPLDELGHDRELLRRIQNGSPAQVDQAMEELAHYCIGVITPYVHRRTSHHDDRLAIIQNTCLFVVERIGAFAFRERPLRHWFISVAENKVKERYYFARRERRSHTVSELEGDGQDGDHPFDHLKLRSEFFSASTTDENLRALPDNLSQPERDRLVHLALKRLPQKQRQIVMLIYFEEITDAEEIGRRVGLSGDSVRVYHHRARKRLQEYADLKELFDELLLC